jgi:hypothetical protein
MSTSAPRTVAAGAGRAWLALGAAVLPLACTQPPPAATRPATAAAPRSDIGWFGPEGEVAEGAAPAATASAAVEREAATQRARMPEHAPSNVGSPLGMNLHGLGYGSTDWVFLDTMRMAGEWVSRKGELWGDGRVIPMDPEGWVLSLAEDQIATTLAPTLGGGEYHITWDGQGELRVDGSKAVLRREPGHWVVDTAPYVQLMITIERVDPMRPIRNIRMIPARYATSYRDHTFHPEFLAKLAPFSVIRFMDWSHIQGTTVSRWSERTNPDFFTQARESGVAYEHMIELSNTLHAEPWICVPHMADDDFFRQLARLLRERLDPDLKVWIEYSNEVWNDSPAFTQAAWARQKGLEMRLDSDANAARLKYQALRSAALFDIFTKELGPTRVVRVMGSQVGFVWAHEVLLDHPKVKGKVDALAIAPYFGGELGDVEREGDLVRNDTKWVLDQLEQKSLPEVRKWIRDSFGVAKKRGLQLVAYEGGQHLAAHPAFHNNAKVNLVMDEANRSPRMKQLYLRLLDDWKAEGGQLFIPYSFAFEPGKWGRWGVLERMHQTRAEAPKYDALLTFIERNKRWW